MLGGATITDRTREHAREMLEQARGDERSAATSTTSRASRGRGSPRERSGRAKSASGR
jgi:hypothetical protein